MPDMPPAIRDAFDMVMFDWAGTMVDFGSRAPVLALIEAFRLSGIPAEESEARADMGRAKADHIRAMLAQPRIAQCWQDTRGTAPDEAAVAEVLQALQEPMIRLARETAHLVPGAAATVAHLRHEGIRIASCTGYSRDMMAAILPTAIAEGYEPDLVVCANETAQGRPSPLMVYKACADLGVWPLSRVVKVDDAEVGMAEGRNAGCFTVGVAASGNAVGLSVEALAGLEPEDRAARVSAAGERLKTAGADVVIDSVADLIPALQAEAARRG